MNQMLDRRQRRNASIIGALVVLGAGAYALYSYLTSEGDGDVEVVNDNDSRRKYTQRPITIILTESILSSNLPLNEILKKTSDVVLVVPPDLSVDEDLQDEFEPDVEYKVIECETYEGVWSVVKHLNGEIIFVVKDDLPSELPEGLERYVGEIVELDQNSSEINESILSCIVNE